MQSAPLQQPPEPAATPTTKPAPSAGAAIQLQQDLAQLAQHREALRTAQDKLLSSALSVIEAGNRLQQRAEQVAAGFRQHRKAEKRRAQRQRRNERQHKESSTQ